MVRIIVPGSLPGERKYRADCRVCNCRFSFAASEAKLCYDQRDGDYYAIDCPTVGCNEIITVSTSAKQYTDPPSPKK